MRKYRIRGGNRIGGTLGVCGSKNAALPIVAALPLCEGESVIHNCPHIADIENSIEILRHLGCRAELKNNTLIVENKGINTSEIPDDMACKMRSSVYFMGSLLGSAKNVKIASPGGCNIGARPIDLHVEGLRAFGAKIAEDDKHLHGSTNGLTGTHQFMKTVSVGTTANLMLAAVRAKGETVLLNAAREPEIVDLAHFLNAAGAIIHGAGTGTITIQGVSKLHGATYRIMPDRIVTGTYLLAAAMTGGDLTLTGVRPFDVKPITANLLAMGCAIKEKATSLRLRGPRYLTAVPHLVTEAHPGFPTDMQAQFVAALASAKGVGVVEERIFESRASHAAELIRMGADITLTTDGRTFIVKGRPRLHAATVSSNDLRGGAALVLAALAADGETTVLDKGYIERGYERLADVLASVGAEIKVA